MPLDIVTVPCRTDNYAYLVHSDGLTLLIDAPETAPIEAALDTRGWSLDEILITHHHADHTAAVADLVDRYGATVCGPRAEEGKLPPLARALSEGDRGGAGDAEWTVIAVPGHTLGHIAFHFPAGPAVFTADSLMALGCGRLFEGTAEMMWDSLSKLAALPPETVVYSGHEYTAANARFARTVDPDNAALAERVQRIEAARAENEPTAQVPLAEELATNPFLRAADAGLRAQLDMADAPDVAVFAEVRRRKDSF